MKAKIVIVAFCVAIVTMTQSASAGAFGPLFFGPGGEFSGSGSNLSGQVKVTFADAVGGGVDITVDTSGLDDNLSEYIAGLYLNLKDDTTTPVGSALDNSDPIVTSIGVGTNAFKADGDGFFDIVIDWEQSAGPGRFEADETDVVTFTLAGGLTPSDFEGTSAPGGGNGTYQAALRARSLDANGAGSGWFGPGPETIPNPVPEASSLAIWALVGVCALMGRKRTC